MRFSTATVALSAATIVAARRPNDFQGFPLSNDFPNPSMDAIATIEVNAGGPLPDGGLPTSLTPEAATAFKLIALNEIFEVAYFSDLLTNITYNVPGYSSNNQKYLMRSFMRIRAQEELHALGANSILKSAGEQTIGGCKYNFMVNDLDSAIMTANLFTDVVLGALPQVQALVAGDGAAEAALIPLIGAIIAQEGEQVGYFRYHQGKIPSSAPFLTGTPASFAYAALSMFIVPGSCPTLPDIPTPKALTVTSTPMAQTMDLEFSVEGAAFNPSDYTMSYISGQHSPFTVPITNVQTSNGMTTFTANFPYAMGIANGLTLVAVTKGPGPFKTIAQVAAAAEYGPGLIEVA